jgi:hypothetical protein
VALCLAFLGVAFAAPQAALAKVPRLLFPIVGHAHFQNDFGDPRGQGSHEGNDLMADWMAPAVAVEAGEVRIYTASERAGCMLYLYGKSGTTYLYIHLNNDRTKKNDNRGGCKPGVAYAPGLRDGQRVRAGQLIGYVGDSGDANGIAYHLHFEVHPNDGPAVSPYRHLRKAERLLFAVPESEAPRLTAGTPTLTITGKIVSYAAGEPLPPANGGNGDAGATSAANGTAPPPPPERPGIAAAGKALVTIAVTRVTLAGAGSWQITRTVSLTVARDAVLERASGKRIRWKDLAAGTKIAVTTAPIALSLDAQRALPGALTAAHLRVL